MAEHAGLEHTRVALYSHDTQGLGHVRRNSLLAAALVAADPGTEVLLLSGVPEAFALPLPPRTSVVTVPPLAKTAAGEYQPRALPLSLETVLSIRSAMLEQVLADFRPDLLVVDKVPLGIHGELRRALTSVRAHGTRTVLGLRDVLDDREVATREWRTTASSEVVRRLYDGVWVYGDPAVYDACAEYQLPEHVCDKVSFTGYLVRGRSELLQPGAATGSAPQGPYVLCLVGGGQDGSALSETFARAVFPAGHRGVVVTGPYLDTSTRTRLVALAGERHDLDVLTFVDNVPALVGGAAATVAMGGYNTVCELLEAGRPALLAPRTSPRREQAVRAERLQAAGLVDVVAPGRLDEAGLASWLAAAVRRDGRRDHPIDLDGLARVPELTRGLLSAPRNEVDRVAV